MNEKASSDALKNILNQAPRNLGAGKLKRWAILCGIVLSLIVLGKILMGDKDLGGHYVTENNSRRRQQRQGFVEDATLGQGDGDGRHGESRRDGICLGHLAANNVGRCG